ncbi:MAG TPA: Ig-like domain-containing protein, partial [Actinomycetota bacterium]|nr:Ig-like domain-containing protein [Actinomycetota bacterium]
STADNTIRRKASIEAGDPVGSDPFDPAVEWDGYPIDTFTGLGTHSTTPAEQAPGVSSTSPADGATGVALDANISVTFSEPVNATSASFELGCSTTSVHTYTLSGGPTTYTLNPDTNFTNSETCTVTVRALQVTDQDSADPPDNMAADRTIQFTTAGLVDAPPAVSSTSPANGSNGVAPDANVIVTFDEGVNAAAGAFAISCTASGAHPFAVSGGPNSFTLNPEANFFESETCTVNIEADNVTDQDSVDPPDNMAADYSFSFSTLAPIPIGTVQGPVSDSTDGATQRSTYAPTPPGPDPCGSNANGAGQTVLVRGVIYQKTLARTSAGASQHGFFMQNVGQTADGDPNTSDGIFVFLGGFTTLIGGYTPTVGDEVVISGRVTEFFCLTQLSSASLLRLVRSGAAIEAELPPFAANPPDDSEAAERYWERREGMRGQAPVGSIVVGRRQVFGPATTMDAEDAVINPTHPVALRANQYARRTYRDPHPLDNNPAQWDDNNGFRIILGSLGVKAAANDNTALIAPVRTYDTLTTS